MGPLLQTTRTGQFNRQMQYGIRFKNDPEFIKDCIQDVFFN